MFQTRQGTIVGQNLSLQRLCKGAQHGGYKAEDRDGLPPDKIDQVMRVLVSVGFGKYQTPTMLNGPQQFPYCNVKCIRCFLKNHVFCLQRAQFIYPLNSGSSAPMLYQNPFRMACCSGGIDHISEMSRACNLLWIG